MEPGARVGAYEVVERIGAGGMGEVYRARDTRLGRDVAIKTLPASLARDPERLARFEREARLLAALNHPNVGAIYGVEDAGGRPALVLELVEGPTLHDLVHERSGGSRPLAQEETVDIARQIADGLDAAHEKGIVHRDLKPANVKVTAAGVVKVLDFGLGRVSDPASGSGPSEDPTLTSDRTAAGQVLGTAAYMSPEQARGRTADRRADIWAFGCVLYEMLTGRRAFGAETVSDTLVQVITREPDWTLVPAGTPTPLRRLLRRCLQKDARRRLRDAADARLELDDASGTGDSPDPRAAPAVERRLLRLTDSPGTVGSPALSPDGKMVAFVAVAGGRRQIFIRMLAGGAPLQVTRDSADHDEPRWMPDSSALVYHSPSPGAAGGHLWQVAALGGAPRRIAPAMAGADVSHDGRRLAFFQQRSNGLALVVAGLDGSGARDVLVARPEHWCDRPRWSPDDRHLAFNRGAVLFDARLEVVDAQGGEPLTIVRTSWLRGHSWLADGSGLVYSSTAGSTMSYPPTCNLRLVGRDGTADRQLTFGDASYLHPDTGASDCLLATREHGRSDVWRFPIEGGPADNVRKGERITRQTGQIQVPSVSPDGREVVYVSDSGGHSNLWLAAVDGSSIQQITFEEDPGVAVALPLWAPGGDRILFLRSTAGRIDLCLLDREGGAARTLVAGAFAPCWSADGRSVYCCPEVGRIERIDVETGAVEPVRADRAACPVVSPVAGPLYFTRLADLLLGARGESEVCRATPDDGPAEVLARIANDRVPLATRLVLHFTVSPDGRWLCMPLVDGTTTNIWLLPTDGGPMRAVTEFGERSVFIARHLSWSPDSRYVYAAVADTSVDVVLLEGLLG
jgi:Tol biopolymer transport system component